MATELALLQQGRRTWAGTPRGLLADADGQVWTLTLPDAEYERLRGALRVSAAIRRAGKRQVSDRRGASGGGGLRETSGRGG